MSQTIEQRIAAIHANLKNSQEQLENQGKHMAKNFQYIVAASTKQFESIRETNKSLEGMARSTKHMEKIQKQNAKTMEKTFKNLEKLEAELLKAQANSDDKRVRKLQDMMQMEMKHTKQVMKYREEKLAEENKEIEDAMMKRKKLMMLDGKEIDALGKKLGSSISGAISIGKSGDIAGGISGAAGGLKEMSGFMKGMPGLLGKVGKALGPIGMALGAFGMIASVLMDADKAAKELNKSLLNGATAFDMFGKNVSRGKLTKRLYNMREMSYDMGMRFRMAAGDVAQLASTLNSANLRYAEMGTQMVHGADQVGGLSEVLGSVIVKSKMLGVEASVVAEKFGEMNENFAMDLSQISDAFTHIYQAAQTTGISTQKFFGLVTQLTGGMSLLNVDFAQTAAIAGELVEALGEAAAGDFLSDLAGRGSKMSYTDRIRSAKLAGGRGVGITKEGVKARADRIQTSAGYNTLVENADFQRTMRAMNIKGFDPDDLVASFKKMSKADKGVFMGLASNTKVGGSAETARILRDLSQTVTAMQMGNSAEARAVQMGHYNIGENMAQMLAEAGAFVNLEKGESLGGLERAVLEKISGRSGMQVDQLVTVVDKFRDNMEAAKKYGSMIKEHGSDMAMKRLGMSKEDFDKMMKEQYRLSVDHTTGAIKHSETGREIKDMKTYLVNMGHSLELGPREKGKQMSYEQAMTAEIVSNTASVSVVLENLIGKQLNKISGFVESILHIMGFRVATRDSAKTSLKLDELNKVIDGLYDERTNAQKTLSKYGAKVKSGKASDREKEMYKLAENSVIKLDETIKYNESKHAALAQHGWYKKDGVSNLHADAEAKTKKAEARMNEKITLRTAKGAAEEEAKLAEEEAKLRKELKMKQKQEAIRQAESLLGDISYHISGDIGGLDWKQVATDTEWKTGHGGGENFYKHVWPLMKEMGLNTAEVDSILMNMPYSGGGAGYANRGDAGINEWLGLGAKEVKRSNFVHKDRSRAEAKRLSREEEGTEGYMHYGITGSGINQILNSYWGKDYYESVGLGGKDWANVYDYNNEDSWWGARGLNQKVFSEETGGAVQLFRDKKEAAYLAEVKQNDVDLRKLQGVSDLQFKAMQEINAADSGSIKRHGAYFSEEKHDKATEKNLRDSGWENEDGSVNWEGYWENVDAGSIFSVDAPLSEGVTYGKASEEATLLEQLVKDEKTNQETSTKEQKKTHTILQKELPKDISDAMLQAMLAEKLFETAGMTGLSLTALIEAMEEEKKEVAAGNAGGQVKRLITNSRKFRQIADDDEKARILQILGPLGLAQDRIQFEDGTFQNMGRGSIHIDPVRGTAYQTHEKDITAHAFGGGKAGRGGGGGGINIGTVNLALPAGSGAAQARYFVEALKNISFMQGHKAKKKG